jgi:hypothetical protein
MSAMKPTCPRCGQTNPPPARFCGRCGLSLAVGPDGSASAGCVRHPDALAAPEGFRACERATDLHYRWAAAWGAGRLLGAEPLAVALFNGGYPLRSAVLKISGVDAAGRPLFEVEQTIPELPRGVEVLTEIPSYEQPDAASDVSVSLITAEYEPI